MGFVLLQMTSSPGKYAWPMIVIFFCRIEIKPCAENYNDMQLQTLNYTVNNFREDWEFLVKNEALPEERMRAVETGGCPHAAIREVG